MRRRLTALAGASALALAGPALGITDIWTGTATDGLWDSPANWSFNRPPTEQEGVDLTASAVGPRTIALHADSAGGPTPTLGLIARDDYTLTNGTLIAPAMLVSAGKTLTLNSRVSADNLVLGAGTSWTGTVALGGDNRGTFTGNVKLGETSLRITDSKNLGDVNAVVFGDSVFGTTAAPAALVIDGTTTLNQGIGFANAAAMASLTANVDVTAGHTATFTQNVTRFHKAGAGTVLLPGTGFRDGRVMGNGTLQITGTPDQTTGGAVEMRGGTLELIGTRLASKITVPAAMASVGDYRLLGTGNATFAGNVSVPIGKTLTIDNGTDPANRLTMGYIGSGYGDTNVRFTGTGVTTLTQPYGGKVKTTIDGTTVVITDREGILGYTDYELTIQSGGVLEFAWAGAPPYEWPLHLADGGTLRAARQVSMSSQYGVPITVASGAHATLATKAATDLISLPQQGIAGGADGAQLRVTGPGRTALSSAGTYAGDWLVDNGWLLVRTTAGLGTGTTPIQVGTTAGRPALLEAINISLSRNVTLHNGSELRSGNGTGLGSPAITQFAGDMTVQSGATVKLSTRDAVDVLTIGDGANDFTGGGAGATVRVGGPGKVELAQWSNLAAGWSVDAGTLVVKPGAQLGGNGNAGASAVDSLTVEAGAKLDLTSNSVVIRNSVVGSASGGTYDGISWLIQSGRLVTMTADAANGLTALGVASGEVGDTPFQGVSIDAGDAIVMYTYAGDANLDGLISGDDYAAIDFNVTIPGASGWVNGDFNYDGIISGDDYSIIDFNIVAQGTPFPTASGASGVTAVPEPVLGLVGTVMLSVARTRRRRGFAARGRT